ncbi:MAG: caspase family protein, partial [Oricola sp.]|nr:caspase family protein [Oricola sp.]
MKNSFLRKRGVVLAANMAFGALLAFPALAQNNYALVVAVSKYENLDETLWLAGPVNDAKLVHEYLLDGAPIDFTEDRITLLADGIDGATAPTNAHIHEAFAALAEKAEPGDFVFLHFSGHGSQSPARVQGQEQDGLDELFLPSDISNWDMSTGTIPNALVDDDLGQMINRIIDKGANVWAVFDSCH